MPLTYCDQDSLDKATTYGQLFSCISPYSVAYLAVAFSLGLSIIGAGWGIYMTGAALVGNAIKMPRIASRNFISVIFCEATAVYGIIMSIILQSKIKDTTLDDDEKFGQAQLCAFSMLCAGLCCGLSNVASGMAIGVIGVVYYNPGLKKYFRADIWHFVTAQLNLNSSWE